MKLDTVANEYHAEEVKYYPWTNNYRAAFKLINREIGIPVEDIKDLTTWETTLVDDGDAVTFNKTLIFNEEQYQIFIDKF